MGKYSGLFHPEASQISRLNGNGIISLSPEENDDSGSTNGK